MIGFPARARIFLAVYPVDMRKQLLVDLETELVLAPLGSAQDGSSFC